MDFFERQEQARRKTKSLLVYFILCVALTIAAVYFAVVFTFFFGVQKKSSQGAQLHLWNPQLFFYVSAGTIAIVTIGSLTKMKQLSAGGGAVAVSLGGRLLDPQTRDVNELKLRNVVEEMAIASGVPVPQIYILDEESGINAFAAGHTTSDAAIGVTRGAIELLNRDELQGVMAHEFSHILNGDMRLNLRLIGWISGIVCLTVIGRILLRTSQSSYRSSSRKKGGNPLPLLGILLLIIGGVGVFFGRLIKAAISRQREFLADSAAVQFTRNPNGLAGALKKIGGLSFGSRLESPNTEEASHLFFGNGLRESWLKIFATHPPLTERILLLEPAFDGSFETVAPRMESPPVNAPRRASIPLPPIIPPPPISSFSQPRKTVSMRAATAVAQIGAPTPAHLDYVGQVIEELPASIENSLREPFGATAIVYALLLSSDAAVRKAQVQQITSAHSQPMLQEALKLASSVQQLGTRARLPLVEMTFPALRQLSPAQYAEFSSNVRTLVHADQEIDLFEYALQKTLLRHLKPQFEHVRKPVIQYYSLRGLRDECAVLLSALAQAGHDDQTQIAAAFSLGAQHLNLPDVNLAFRTLEECSLERIDGALDLFVQSAPQCKKRLLDACAQAVASDGVIQSGEAELLRAIADTLDCPMPPLVQ